MKSFKDYPLLDNKKKYISLFYPYISKNSFKSIKKVLSSRWVGQGPLVDKFERNRSEPWENVFNLIALDILK